MKKLFLSLLTFIIFDTIFIGFQSTTGMSIEWETAMDYAISNGNLKKLKEREFDLRKA